MVSTVGAVYDRALFLTSGAKGRICDEKRAVIGAVNKLESSVIPLLARPQGGVAASSRKFRAATEADAAGVVFHLFSSENHPGLAVRVLNFLPPRQRLLIFPNDIPAAISRSDSHAGERGYR